MIGERGWWVIEEENAAGGGGGGCGREGDERRRIKNRNRRYKGRENKRQIR